MNFTKEYLLWLFDYDKETGKLYWKNHPCKRIITKFAGQEAGTTKIQRDISTQKYRQVVFYGKSFLVHRIIWFLENGWVPEVIDHINGNGIDNRISNLRAVSQRENTLNREYHREGKIAGGTFHKRLGKWQSKIYIDGKYKHLGTFDSEKEAQDAYWKAKNLL